jgi:hypothetical protein
MSTAAAGHAPDLHLTETGSMERGSSGVPSAAVPLDGAARSRAPQRITCTLCLGRIERGQPRHACAGGEAHRSCYDKRRRHTAVPAVPQGSDDAMDDGLHALHSAALLLLQ